MSRILAVYGTSYGQTERVIQRMARVLMATGHTVSILRGGQSPTGPAMAGFDAYLIAASVLLGRHQRYMRDLVRAHAHLLNATASAFVSVCGAAGGHSPPEQQQAQAYIDRFLRETGWQPRRTTSVGGAIAYTRYGPITRWVIKQISRRKGGPTDTSRDHESTDWAAVDDFACRFAVEVARPEAPTLQSGTRRLAGI
jgi:menaquinone-dependent protoporphyrinogen oxidase